jgi:hypothetical protein
MIVRLAPQPLNHLVKLAQRLSHRSIGPLTHVCIV